MKNALGIEEPEDDFKLGDEFSVDGGASTTAKSPPIPPTPTVAPPMPQAMAPKPAPAAAAAPTVAKPMPGMPADVTPEALRGYLEEKRSAIGKYGADRQYDAEMRNVNARRGLGYGLAAGGATLADAIMQGVAGAGNPGFAKQLEDRVSGLADREAGAMERARKNTMEEVDAKQKVDYMDPGSTMSKMYQEAFGPIFQKMGYSPASVFKMPASQIANIATLGIQFEDAKSQQELKRAMLGIQGMTAKANIINQVQQRKEAGEKSRMEAAEGLQKRPWYQKIAEAPFVPLPKSAATKEMERQLEDTGATEHSFGSESEAEAAGLPAGTEVRINGRRAVIE